MDTLSPFYNFFAGSAFSNVSFLFLLAPACPVLKLPDWALLIIFRLVPQDSNLLAIKCTCRRFNVLFYDVSFYTRHVLVVRSKIVHSIVDNIVYYSVHCLQRIDFSHCTSLKDNDILNILVKCRRIRSVTLSFCVSERALMYTAVYATSLSELNVTGCCSASTTFMQAVLERHASSLQSLILSDCMGLRKGNEFDEMVDMLGKTSSLQVLDVSWTKKSYTACPFHERHIVGILQGCKSLRSLHLSGSVITTAVVDTMSKHCPDLTSLSLGRTCLEDDDLIRLMKYCNKLKYLDLSSCSLLTSRGFDSLAALRGLQRLVLNNCIQLKGDSLSYILGKVPSLQHLEVVCCVSLLDRDFNQDMCSNLKSIAISQTRLTQNFVNEFMKRKTSAVITCRNCCGIEREVYVVIGEV